MPKNPPPKVSSCTMYTTDIGRSTCLVTCIRSMIWTWSQQIRQEPCQTVVLPPIASNCDPDGCDVICQAVISVLLLLCKHMHGTYIMATWTSVDSKPAQQQAYNNTETIPSKNKRKGTRKNQWRLVCHCMLWSASVSYHWQFLEPLLSLAVCEAAHQAAA